MTSRASHSNSARGSPSPVARNASSRLGAASDAAGLLARLCVQPGAFALQVSRHELQCLVAALIDRRQTMIERRQPPLLVTLQSIDRCQRDAERVQPLRSQPRSRGRAHPKIIVTMLDQVRHQRVQEVRDAAGPPSLFVASSAGTDCVA